MENNIKGAITPELHSAEWWKAKRGFFPDGRKLKILAVHPNSGG